MQEKKWSQNIQQSKQIKNLESKNTRLKEQAKGLMQEMKLSEKKQAQQSTQIRDLSEDVMALEEANEELKLQIKTQQVSEKKPKTEKNATTAPKKLHQ